MMPFRPVGLALVLAAATGAAAAAEEESPIGRPLVRGGIYDKPFLAHLGESAALGGYLDAHFRYLRTDGATDEMTFKLQRINLFTYASLSDRIRVASEIEFEDGGQEVKVELAIVDFEIHPALTFRGGIILSPLGRFNLAHDSPANDLTDRPLVSTEIIPTTLSEPGMGFLGSFNPTAKSLVTYEIYAVNGFSEGVILDDGDGARIPAGKDNWEDENNRPSLVSRVAGSPHPSSEIGLSIHTGPYNVFKEEGLTVDERRNLTIFAVDGDFRWNRLRLSGEYARARIELPEGSLFAENQQGIYVEVAGTFLEGAMRTLPSSRLTGAARLDLVDFDADSTGDSRRRLTFGVNFRPIAETAFKLDYLHEWARDPMDNEAKSAGLLFSTATYF